MGIYDVQLLRAIETDDQVLAKQLIGKIGNVNYQNVTRHTALHSAVAHNNVGVAKMLLSRGADVMLMPKRQTYENGHECPLLMALKRGRSHEAMQLMLLAAVRTIVPCTLSENQLRKIAMLAHYAMLYTTPLVFYKAIEGDAVDDDRRNSEGLTPLMFTMRRVSMFESSTEVCQRKMQHMAQIVTKHPHMLWQRYSRESVKTGRAILCQSPGSTALGMVLFEVMTARRDRMQLNKIRYAANQQMHPQHPSLLELGHKIQRDGATDHFLEHAFIPCFWAHMLQQMRTALGMATHDRLGGSVCCHIKCLSADVMDMVFEAMLIAMTRSDVAHVLL